MIGRLILLLGAALLALVVVVSLDQSLFDRDSRVGQVSDEALSAGRSVESMPHARDDYFREMDGAISLTSDISTPSKAVINETLIQGRNMWLVWTGGNDRFWDQMSQYTFGAFDLLKIVTSHPSQTIENQRGRIRYDRQSRWEQMGLINEPCFQKPSGPDPTRFGLWLDTRLTDSKCAASDPFASESRYPGVLLGSRGKTFKTERYGEVKLPVGSYYGYPTGIVGLRLFPNPAFDDAAAKAWDAERYYTDPTYYNRKDLIKPYRVGMSCGFCHVGPSPTHPPVDPENPQWADLSSTVGAQYLWVDRLFTNNADRRNFFYQIAHTYKPGTMDTSLVATDSINNPRTMNAIYGVLPRLAQALHNGNEKLGKGADLNKQFNDYHAFSEPDLGPLELNQYFIKPKTVFVPRVLKDGADSVGILGALNRVHLNIGLFSEEWLLHFNPVVGGKQTSPIRISDAEKNSVYWKATEQGTPSMAIFLALAGRPDRLEAALPKGDLRNAKQELLPRGKKVFAEACAGCHSSKQPTNLPVPPEADLAKCATEDYVKCFGQYLKWIGSDSYKAEMVRLVSAPDFIESNYLSTDLRVPVTVLQTNACSPLAANGTRNNIWDNFTSETYKDLPSVGKYGYRDPVTGDGRTFDMPAGGRGYTRPPSLISLWSTAPYLLNNELGPYSQDPSVDARLKNFQEGMREMLWPALRERDALLASKGVYKISRTTEVSYLTIPNGYIPRSLRSLLAFGFLVPELFNEAGDIVIGPIPKGIPVNLLANLRPISESESVVERTRHLWNLATFLIRAAKDLKSVPPREQFASDAMWNDALKEHFKNLVTSMIALSTCPDFETNRGHYFGTELARDPSAALTDEDKLALIEFLKTF